MKAIIKALAAVMFLLTLSTVAVYADENWQTGPDFSNPTVIENGPIWMSSMRSHMPACSEVIAYHITNPTIVMLQNDTVVQQNLNALNAIFFKYDEKVMGILTPSQQVDFLAWQHCRFYDNRVLDNLTMKEYVVLLSEKCHLLGWQEDMLRTSEHYFLAEARPIWLAMEARETVLLASFTTGPHIAIETTTTTVSTPPPETPAPEVTQPVPTPAPVAPAPQKKFIRNKDLK